MSECRMCRERGQTWEGSPPKCAFGAGAFSHENWNCATVNAIRDIAESEATAGAREWCDDQWYATIRVYDESWDRDDDRPLALWVSWYKHRGGTDALWLLFESAVPQLPTEADLLHIISRCAAKPG